MLECTLEMEEATLGGLAMATGMSVYPANTNLVVRTQQGSSKPLSESYSMRNLNTSILCVTHICRLMKQNQTPNTSNLYTAWFRNGRTVKRLIQEIFFDAHMSTPRKHVLELLTKVELDDSRRQ
mmetsp:Transcript_39501/g.46155  ORF Transcript_39501/g.46155 Transcript_39501/m.46155 type:complete len:124 (+) Transcript_39501:1005-1376(+)